MITLITGAPGAGKTAGLVDLLDGLAKDRALFVFGLDGLKVPHVELKEPHDWMASVPDGAAVVIDEVQDVWRPRGPGKAVPPDVAALEVHRHRGLDFFLTTQSPNLLDSNVRALVGRHIHLRDLGFLGRWWYEWPECYDQCRSGWRSAPIKKRYKLPKRIFSKYISATKHIKPIRSFPKPLIVLVVALLVGAGFGYRGFVQLKAKGEPVAAAKLGLAVGAPGAAAAVSAAPVAAAPKVVDELVDFLPRVSDRPWTAPAYDDLRKVAAMPRIAGGICKGGECVCYDASAVRLDVSSEACKRWVDRPPFDPYQAAPPPAQVASAAGTAQSPRPARSEDRAR